MAMANVYTPLDSSRSEIRILHLQPALNIHDAIVLNLRTRFLDESGAGYGALSYTRGESTEGRFVQLDNEPQFPVTDNLYYALRRLRHRRKMVVLWIDALCINQDDIGERSQQVGLMTEIYSKADHVWVWIGESEREMRTDGVTLNAIHLPFIRGIESGPFDNEIHHFTEAMRRTQPHWWDRA